MFDVVSMGPPHPLSPESAQTGSIHTSLPPTQREERLRVGRYDKEGGGGGPSEKTEKKCGSLPILKGVPQGRKMGG